MAGSWEAQKAGRSGSDGFLLTPSLYRHFFRPLLFFDF
jgi:hypothetical protein